MIEASSRVARSKIETRSCIGVWRIFCISRWWLWVWMDSRFLNICFAQLRNSWIYSSDLSQYLIKKVAVCILFILLSYIILLILILYSLSLSTHLLTKTIMQVLSQQIDLIPSFKLILFQLVNLYIQISYLFLAKIFYINLCLQ